MGVTAAALDGVVVEPSWPKWAAGRPDKECRGIGAEFGVMGHELGRGQSLCRYRSQAGRYLGTLAPTCQR